MVLTYNRKELLSKCLTAVANQTYPCDRIIVVNNASVDETEAFLEGEWGDKVEILTLSRNIGAAGGYAMGIRAGYQSGAELLWVMDDDVIPDPEALEKLMDARRFLQAQEEPFPYLCSVIRTSTGLMTNTTGIDLRFNEIWDYNWPKFLDRSLVPINRATFCATLLPRETLREHGTLISEMFIWGDDVEYTLRASKTAPGYLVGESKAVHLRKIEGDLSIFNETDPVRIGYHFFRVRNGIFIARKFHSRQEFLAEVRLNIKRALHLLAKGQFRKTQIMARGIWAGLFYAPAPQSADRPFDKDDPVDFEAFNTRYRERRLRSIKEGANPAAEDEGRDRVARAL
jgi:dTDP-4-dehydrorhamnose reductase